MKKIFIYILIIFRNTVLAYFIILGLQNFNTVNNKTLQRAFLFSLITSLGLIFSFVRIKKIM